MNETLKLNWVKCQKNQWCSFKNVDVSFVTTQGVFVVWHAGNPGAPSRVVHVGHGKIATSIKMLRTNPYFSNFSRHGTLYLTWASVAADKQANVVRYLVEKWRPLGGDVQTEVEPIAVNSPW